MPVTELVTLALKAGSSVDTIKAQLLHGGELQAAVAGYPLRFFSTSTSRTGSTIGSDKKEGEALPMPDARKLTKVHCGRTRRHSNQARPHRRMGFRSRPRRMDRL
jgi:hypothetical protein